MTANTASHAISAEALRIDLTRSPPSASCVSTAATMNAFLGTTIFAVAHCPSRDNCEHEWGDNGYCRLCGDHLVCVHCGDNERVAADWPAHGTAPLPDHRG